MFRTTPDLGGLWGAGGLDPWLRFKPIYTFKSIKAQCPPGGLFMQYFALISLQARRLAKPWGANRFQICASYHINVK